MRTQCRERQKRKLGHETVVGAERLSPGIIAERMQTNKRNGTRNETSVERDYTKTSMILLYALPNKIEPTANLFAA
jgi:hypothetical protein